MKILHNYQKDHGKIDINLRTMSLMPTRQSIDTTCYLIINNAIELNTESLFITYSSNYIHLFNSFMVCFKFGLYKNRGLFYFTELMTPTTK